MSVVILAELPLPISFVDRCDLRTRIILVRGFIFSLPSPEKNKLGDLAMNCTYFNVLVAYEVFTKINSDNLCVIFFTVFR